MMIRRLFSTTAKRASNIGSSPIILPEGVKIVMGQKNIDAVTQLRMNLEKQRGGKPKIHLTQTAQVQGPNGSVSLDVADFVKVEHIENGSRAVISVEDPNAKYQRQMWGTTRTLLQNGVTGVSEGHIAIVKFVGTGFRAILEQPKDASPFLSLRVGYCVPIKVPIPRGIKVTVPLPHRLIIEGHDKQQVKQLAANIRKHRPPEPYKGKGIFIDDETIKLKQRKIK